MSSLVDVINLPDVRGVAMSKKVKFNAIKADRKRLIIWSGGGGDGDDDDDDELE